MAKLLGKNYRLFVGDGASPEVFSQVAGQRDLNLDASVNLIDISSKDDYPYRTQDVGRSDFQINVTGVLDVPDTGLDRIIAIWESGQPVNMQVKNVGTSPDTVVFAAAAVVGGFTRSFADEQPASYSFTMGLTSSPTTDDLTP